MVGTGLKLCLNCNLNGCVIYMSLRSFPWSDKESALVQEEIVSSGVGSKPNVSLFVWTIMLPNIFKY